MMAVAVQHFIVQRLATTVTMAFVVVSGIIVGSPCIFATAFYAMLHVNKFTDKRIIDVQFIAQPLMEALCVPKLWA